MTTTRLTFRCHEIADQLGVGVSTVKRWVASGELTHYRVGGVVLIDADAVDVFLNAHREGNHIPRPARTRRTR